MSSSSAIHPKEKYDVFISFRGEDTRKTFTSHLHKALERKKILTYVDYKLERGDEIGPALVKAIEESKISVIIFSRGYASSTWCLEELSHILQCKKRYGQLVIPIFYDINPSNVKRQEGSYADAFSQLEERFKDRMNRVLKWRTALTDAAKIVGFDSRNTRFESDFVEGVVKTILAKLNRKSSSDITGLLVGVESRIQQIESLLCIQPQDLRIRTLGIWGMGGIGKTTLASVVFDRLASQFEATCYLANVREESKRHGQHYLRNELLRELLMEEDITLSARSPFSNTRLSRTKVLVLLDDVDDLCQVDRLVGDQVQFGPGSRIIITT